MRAGPASVIGVTRCSPRSDQPRHGRARRTARRPGPPGRRRRRGRAEWASSTSWSRKALTTADGVPGREELLELVDDDDLRRRATTTRGQQTRAPARGRCPVSGGSRRRRPDEGGDQPRRGRSRTCRTPTGRRRRSSGRVTQRAKAHASPRRRGRRTSRVGAVVDEQALPRADARAPRPASAGERVRGAGACWRIACSSSIRSWPGSRPRSSCSVRRAWRIGLERLGLATRRGRGPRRARHHRCSLQRPGAHGVPTASATTSTPAARRASEQRFLRRLRRSSSSRIASARPSGQCSRSVSGSTRARGRGPGVNGDTGPAGARRRWPAPGRARPAARRAGCRSRRRRAASR